MKIAEKFLQIALVVLLVAAFVAAVAFCLWLQGVIVCWVLGAFGIAVTDVWAAAVALDIVCLVFSKAAGTAKSA